MPPSAAAWRAAGVGAVGPAPPSTACTSRPLDLATHAIVCLQEFPARDRAYYLAALADGRLRVEGCPEVRRPPAARLPRLARLACAGAPPACLGASPPAPCTSLPPNTCSLLQLTADTLLKDGQRMRHFVHRHEPPVTAGPIQARCVH